MLTQRKRVRTIKETGIPNKESEQIKMKKSNTFTITYLAVILALTLFMAFTPYVGFIPIGPVEITLFVIPTAVVAILSGKRFGVAASTLFGLASLAVAWFIQPDGAVFFKIPWISVLPRIPIGLVVALVYKYSKRLFKGNDLSARIVGAAFGAVTNTVLVLLSIWLTALFVPDAVIAFFSPEFVAISADLAVFGTIIGFITFNFIIEIVLNAVIAPPVVYALRKARVFSSPAFDRQIEKASESFGTDVK